MEKEQILDLIDDRMAQRFECYAQAQNAIHEDFHRKVIETIESSIKTIVTSKIDHLAEQITLLNEQIKPVNETKKWFKNTGDFAKGVAGFLTPWVIIGAFIKWLLKL